MKYKTRVSLTMEELVTLASDMEIRIAEIDQLIFTSGDPNGFRNKEKKKCEVLFGKFKKALDRV